MKKKGAKSIEKANLFSCSFSQQDDRKGANCHAILVEWSTAMCQYYSSSATMAIPIMTNANKAMSTDEAVELLKANCTLIVRPRGQEVYLFNATSDP